MANGKDRRITVRDLVENGSLQGISVIAGRPTWKYWMAKFGFWPFFT